MAKNLAFSLQSLQDIFYREKLQAELGEHFTTSKVGGIRYGTALLDDPISSSNPWSSSTMRIMCSAVRHNLYVFEVESVKLLSSKTDDFCLEVLSYAEAYNVQSQELLSNIITKENNLLKEAGLKIVSSLTTTLSDGTEKKHERSGTMTLLFLCKKVSNAEMLKRVNSIIIRRDPPIDDDYRNIVRNLINLQKEVGVKVVNNPELFLQYNEKSITKELPEEFVPRTLYVPSSKNSKSYQDKDFINHELVEKVTNFAKEANSSKIVIKISGMFSGIGVSILNNSWIAGASSSELKSVLVDFLRTSQDDVERYFSRKNIPNAAEKAKTLIENILQKEEIIIQEFIDEIDKTGDIRALVINGSFVGAFTRMADNVGSIANTFQGGKIYPITLNETQRELISKICIFTKQKGILFAGVDIIGNKITEVNYTSPSGFAFFDRTYPEYLKSKNIKSVADIFIKELSTSEFSHKDLVTN